MNNPHLAQSETGETPAPAEIRRCIVLVAGNRRCGAETHYRTAEQSGTYSGYYHVDSDVTGHHAVPSNWI